eukprot:scaffold122857_cov30-Tisochrysis_lutea.AAC.1
MSLCRTGVERHMRHDGAGGLRHKSAQARTLSDSTEHEGDGGPKVGTSEGSTSIWSFAFKWYLGRLYLDLRGGRQLRALSQVLFKRAVHASAGLAARSVRRLAQEVVCSPLPSPPPSHA